MKTAGSVKLTMCVRMHAQVNKNWLLKARVGTDSAAAGLALRVWGAGVSLAAAASVHLDYAAPTR